MNENTSHAWQNDISLLIGIQQQQKVAGLSRSHVWSSILYGLVLSPRDLFEIIGVLNIIAVNGSGFGLILDTLMSHWSF